MRIAVASGKGGTGKTFIATNLFLTFLQKKDSVILVDCDAEVPNSLNFFDLEVKASEEVSQYIPKFNLDNCTFCGRCMEYCEYNAIFCLPEQKKLKLITSLCHGCKACEVACPEDVITPSENVIGKVTTYVTPTKATLIEGRMKEGCMTGIPVIKKALKKAEELATDYLIADAPPGTSCPFINTVSDIDYVILVTEPTPFGLSDLRQAVETLKIMKKPYGVVINRAGLGDHGVYHYIKEERIPLLAEIPFDKSIALSYSKGELIVGKDKNITRIFKHIRKEILNYGNSSSKR